jgi:hypothetical protein
LTWRKEFNPKKAAVDVFKEDRFEGLRYITVVPVDCENPTPAGTTWNIYGAVKEYEKTFVPVEESVYHIYRTST